MTRLSNNERVWQTTLRFISLDRLFRSEPSYENNSKRLLLCCYDEAESLWDILCILTEMEVHSVYRANNLNKEKVASYAQKLSISPSICLPADNFEV